MSTDIGELDADDVVDLLSARPGGSEAIPQAGTLRWLWRNRLYLYRPEFAETDYAYRPCSACGGTGVFVQTPYAPITGRAT